MTFSKKEILSREEKPAPMPPIAANIPTALRRNPHWVAWRWVQVDNKWTKVPYQLSGQYAKSNTSSTWTEFESIQTGNGHFDGIGYVFAKAVTGERGETVDYYCGVDLDEALDEHGQLKPWAQPIVAKLNSYTEISPTRTGVKIFMIASVPQAFSLPCGDGHAEIFDRGRYFTVTGHRLDGTPTTIEDRQDELNELLSELGADLSIVPAKAKDADSEAASAALQSIASVWPPEGHRHTVRLCVAGCFQTAGFSEDQALVAMEQLHDFANDGAVEDGCKAVESTFKRQEKNQGWPSLETALIQAHAGTPITAPIIQAVLAQARTRLTEAAATLTAAAWEDPIPLRWAITPPFPVHLLPFWMGEYVKQLAVETQTPADLAAMLAITEACAAMARGHRVEIRPGWEEPINLWTVPILPPGNRKSAVFTKVMEPVEKYEHDQKKCQALDVARSQSGYRVLQSRVKAAEKDASSCPDPIKRMQLEKDAADLAAEVAKYKLVYAPKYLADDITPESCGKVLSEAGGSLLIAAPEGTIWDIACGKYSGNPNLDVLLKGHAGDAIRVDRVGREPDRILSPALSIAIAVQPVALQGNGVEYLIRGRGFLARWLYALPMSTMGQRKVAAAPVKKVVAESFFNQMLSLWKNQPEDYRVHLVNHPESHRFGKLTIRFSAEADAEMQEFERWLEPQLGPGGALEHIADWASKLAGAAARIAAMFHGCDYVPIADAQGYVTDNEKAKAAFTPINARNVKAAIQLAREYLLPHAIAAFTMMQESRHMENARRILAWLARHKDKFGDFANGFRVRQRTIHHDLLGSRYTPDEATATIKILVDHGYLRPVPADHRKGAGRPPGPEFEIHPSVFKNQNPENGSQNRQNSDDEADQGNFDDFANQFGPSENVNRSGDENQTPEIGSQNRQKSEPEKRDDRSF